MRAVVFLTLFLQNPAKSHSTPKIALSMCYDLGKSSFEYEKKSMKIDIARPKFVRAE